MTGQAYILASNKTHPEYLETLQAQMRRSISALDNWLSNQDSETCQDREWLVGTKCTIADLSFVIWDMPQILDVCFRGDREVDAEEKRRKTWPEWAKWHDRIVRVDGVENFLASAEAFKT